MYPDYHRSPTGNFTSFLSNREMILEKLLNQKCNVIICVDININCLNDTKTWQLNVILNSYNLINMITFPTSIAGNSSAIDNVFIHK